MIDLHTHSTESDGSEAPETVCELAAAAGCSAFALTDHDSIGGLAAASEACERLGIRLVRGCEVSCTKPEPPPGAPEVSGSVHVLVYFVEGEDGALQRELSGLRTDRAERNRRLVERLRELGVPIDYEMVEAEAGERAGVGRPHFARVLVRLGAAQDVDDAFDRWLANGRPAYVPKARISVEEVAALAREGHAVAVLAHPLSLGLEARGLERLVFGLAEAGLGGLEALYGRYTPEQRKDLRSLARRAGLVATGGSDFHGSFKPDLSVGTGAGDLEVPDELLDELEAARP